MGLRSMSGLEAAKPIALPRSVNNTLSWPAPCREAAFLPIGPVTPPVMSAPVSPQGFATNPLRLSPLSVSKISTRPSRVATASQDPEIAQDETEGASAPSTDLTLNSLTRCWSANLNCTIRPPGALA